MHDAYTVCVPLKIPVQIESIAGYDDTVLLGTRQGHLLMYYVQKNPTENKMDLQLMQYDKTFNKKPIVQIEVIPEYQLLISLCDNVISVHDMSRQNFQLVLTASKTKGATVFTLNIKRTKSLTGETALFVLMCVAVKRKLQFWYWKNQQFLEFAPDIELNDIPKTLAWSEETVCIGFKTEYILYDLSKSPPVKSDLFPTGSSRSIEPFISVINNLFSVGKDEFLIGIDPNIPTWNHFGKSMAAPSSMTKERSSMSPTAKGSKNFRSITWSQTVHNVVWDEPYVVGVINDSLEIHTLNADDNSKGTHIQTIPDLQRVQLLVRTKSGVLFGASGSHLWRIDMIEIPKQVQVLVQQKKFQLALELTSISNDSEEERQSKIHQIRTLYASDLLTKKNYQESMKVFFELKTDPCDVIRLIPDLLPQDTARQSSDTSGWPSIASQLKLEDRDRENGLLALIDYLTEVRHDLGKDLQKSLPLLSIIDTTLLKCYLMTNDSFVAPLLRLNYCHLEEAERSLKKFQKFGELIILYQTKGQHKRALQLLQSQAILPDSCLYGHERTIQYLHHLGSEHKQIIFEFSNWVLEKHPEDGLKIFTEDISEVENLPRAEVLDFLLKNHKPLVIPYLEHIIHAWNETKAIFHNILIQQYLDKLKVSQSDIEKNISESDKNQKQTVYDNTRKSLLEFLIKSNYYSLEPMLGNFPYQDLFEERAVILGKLGKHEKVLAIYIQILGDIEKAIGYCESVYSEDRISKQNEVFTILAKTLLTLPTTSPYSGVPLHPRCLLEPDIETVLFVIEKYAKKLNAYEVCQCLPANIPLSRLKKFLEISLQHHLEKKRKTQLVKSLWYAEYLRMEEKRMHRESERVLLTEFSVCSVCKKKFSNQSAFVRHAGEIMHLSCCKDNKN